MAAAPLASGWTAGTAAGCAVKALIPQTITKMADFNWVIRHCREFRRSLRVISPSARSPTSLTVQVLLRPGLSPWKRSVDNGFERMSFFTTAGFATPGIAALAAAGNASARVQGSTMRSGSTGHAAALQRISATVRESAVPRHQLDFHRVDRRAEALTT